MHNYVLFIPERNFFKDKFEFWFGQKLSFFKLVDMSFAGVVCLKIENKTTEVSDGIIVLIKLQFAFLCYRFS